MMMKVDHDLPGRLLHLTEVEGKGDGCVVRWIWLFTLAPILFIVLFATWHIATDKGRDAEQTRSVLLKYVLPVLTLPCAAFVAERLQARSRRLTGLGIDADADVWLLLFRRSFGGSQRTVCFRRDEVDRVEVSPGVPIRAGGVDHLPVRVVISREHKGRCSVSLSVVGLDRPEEFRDFAFRLAAVGGLPEYRVLKSRGKWAGFALVRAGAGGQRVPPIDRTSNYLFDVLAPALPVAREDLPPFDPTCFPGEYAVLEWAPGDGIRLKRRTRPHEEQMARLVACGFLLTGLLLAAYGFVVGGDRMWSNLLMGMVPFGLGLGFLLSKDLDRPSLVVLDWGTHELQWKSPWTEERVPFDQLLGIETRGIHWVHSKKGHKSWWCQVYAHWRGGVLLLAETDSDPTDPQAPRRVALPLGIELAKSLAIPHRWTEYL